MSPRIRYTANVCLSCNLLQKAFPICVDTPERGLGKEAL